MKKLQGTLEKKEKQLTEAINQNKKIQVLEKQLEETNETIEQLKKSLFISRNNKSRSPTKPN